MTIKDKSLRRLGTAGPEVFPLSLGCMGMSGMYGESDEVESIRAIHAAVDGGVTLLDTGDFYGMGHNELLVGRALRELGSAAREKVLVSVKFGALRAPDGSWLGFDGRRCSFVVSGGTEAFDAVYPFLGSRAQSDLAVALGAECDESGALLVGSDQMSSIDGVYVAGDVVSAVNQISIAVGHAGVAATAIHGALHPNFRRSEH